MKSGPRILIIGRSGQVASALAHIGTQSGADITCLGRPGADLSRPDTLNNALESVAPDIIINAAAYTNVDGAEANHDIAFALNSDGPEILAELARARSVPLIHLSTDCVFDGTLARPYRPTDLTAPLGVYGSSKLAGEQRIAGPGVLTVRVSWIFSTFGSNFVTTMLSLARTRNEVRVVCDQTGCPTHAEDLARGLIEIARQASAPDFSGWDTYHLVGQGHTDRAAMAQAIFADSQAVGGPVAQVAAIPTSDYPTPARRPLNARLDSTRTAETFGVRLPHWRERLTHTVHALVNKEATQ